MAAHQVQLVVVVEMVRKEGKLELGERRTNVNRNKYQTTRHREQRSTQRYSKDSNRGIHGEGVDDAHTYMYMYTGNVFELSIV